MSQDSYDMGDAMASPTTEVDPRAYLRALWRWKWIFLAILVVIPIGVYVVVSREHKVYRSSALLEIQPVAVDTAQFSAGGAPSSNQILNAVAALLTTRSVAAQAAKQLPPPRPTGSSLLTDVTASADTSTGFITVSAKAGSPERAAEIANSFAGAVAVTRARQAVQSLDRAIAELTQELSSLPPRSSNQRTQLQHQIQQDKALRLAQGSNAQIIQSAVPNATPISPHVRSAVLVGLVAALLLGLVTVAVAEAADRRLRNVDDLERLASSPALGTIPEAAFSDRLPTVAEIEAFHALQASLKYFNVEEPQRTIVVASPSKGDGKTTVAIQLAMACARSGEDVVLIDADLRSPQIAERLGITSGAGLPSVLAGTAAPEDALVSLQLPAATRGGSLRVLASTETPPNPPQLLASERMRELLKRVPGGVDRVIIDTSPALLVADSFPLFQTASGTLLVARIDRTFKEAIRRLAWTIRNAGGTVLGTVATGAEARDPYGRYNYSPQVVNELATANGTSAGNGAQRAGRLGSLLRRSGSTESEQSHVGSTN